MAPIEGRVTRPERRWGCCRGTTKQLARCILWQESAMISQTAPKSQL